MRIVQITINTDEKLIDPDESVLWLAIPDNVTIQPTEGSEKYFELTATSYKELVPGVDFVVELS